MALSHNAADLALRMRLRPDRAETALRQAARELAPRLVKTSRAILDSRIYAVTIPYRSGSGGKHAPRWRRSGKLRRAEQGQTDGMDVLLVNDAGHAVPRMWLGLPGGRRIVSPGVQSVQWQQEAVSRLRPVMLEVRRAYLARALRL